MSTRAFARRPRLSPPGVAEGEISLSAPPELPRPTPPNVMTFVLPGAMAVMVVGFVVIGGFSPTSLMMGAMMLTMTVGMVGANRSGGPQKAQLAGERRDYLRYLATTRDEIGRVREAQQRAATWTHPHPRVLAGLAGGRRMWERRQGDVDFTECRVAVGDQELATPLRAPETGPLDEVDPIGAVALRGLVTGHALVRDAPVAVRLASFPLVGVRGDAAAARAMVRAMVAQLATFHGPDGLVLAAVVGSHERASWDWLKWLPHAHHPHEKDGLGPVRLVAGSLAEVDAWLADELSSRPRRTVSEEADPDDPHVVVLVDGGDLSTDDAPELLAGRAGVTVVDLSPAEVGAGMAEGPLAPLAALGGLELEVAGGRVGVRGQDGVSWLGTADALAPEEADAWARAVAPYRLSDGRSGDGPGAAVGSTDLEGMLGLPELAHLLPEQVWRPRPLRDQLRVPIGVAPTGEAVELDLKESAFGGMGPHGLVVGATGSGKSELLRTLVLALAVTHSPETLNLVLVDFKGGATFAGLGDLPHTAAVITNLQDDLTMVDRMYDALSGEMNRRQEALRAAGNLANVREYERARTAGADLAPLPSLFVVCDEFSELLAQKPDFAELFVAIGRLGRSLGIHLLLASQRLEEGRLRGLDSHLSYRIGLKTFSAAESRAVLGVPDAYELPPVPGAGYLKFDTGSMARFKAAYVSGPYVARDGGGAGSGPAGLRPVSFVTSRVDLEDVTVESLPATPAPAVVDPAGRSVLDVVVDRLEGHGTPAHEVWLPPLSTSPTLDGLLDLTVEPGRGLTERDPARRGRLRVPLGVVDLPYEQRRDVLGLDFSGAAGHGLVVGGPQSGKSTTLRTLLTSLALTHTPREVQLYVVDLGGGSLGALAGLPHVGGVAGRREPDRVRRVVAEVQQVVADREARFRALGVESMADYRARQRAGDPDVTDDLFGDVFLVVDGWGALKEDFEDLEATISSLAARSLSFGVHVVVAAGRWQEVRAALKDTVGTRVELRLGDPVESEVDRRLAALVPLGAPGRGLTASRHHLLVGLPRTDGVADGTSLAGAYAQLVREVAAAWDGPRAPEVRMLPERVEVATLAAREGTRAFPVGLSEQALAPVELDLVADPHFLYFADGESGKTTFLRTVVHGVMGRWSAAEARILLVDYRRTLLGEVPPEHLAGYAASADQLEAYLGDLVPLLRGRLPGPDVTPDQLRERSWWSGPEVFVVVDDYDLVAGSPDHPLTALRPLLPQAKDIGLHVVLARRCAGASRALYDPVVQSVRELGSPGFVGTGSRDEGALVGAARPDPSLPAGRGVLVGRRSGSRLVQMAVSDAR